MHKRSGQRGPPQRKYQSGAEAATSPLIPLQEEIQPLQGVVQPLIPLQLPSARAKLQHELSHATATLPNQTGATLPIPTKLSRRRLQKRQFISTTTVTDANVVVVNGSGSTITVASITDVSTGSVAISLPFTTITIPPLGSVTGIISIAAGSAPTPQPNPIPLPSLPPVSTTSSAPISESAMSVQVPSTQLTSSTPSPSSVVVSPSQSGNNQLGSSSTPTSTTSSSSTSASTSSIMTTSSSSNTPTTFATMASSTLAPGSSISNSTGIASTISSSTSTSSSSEYPSSSSTSSSVSLNTSSAGPVSSAAPSSTSSMPAATTTAAAAAASGGPSVNTQVVGGVVGGLAGLALILGLLLLLMRWWRKRRSGSMMLRSIDDEVAPPGTSHSNAPMTQNPTSTASGAGAIAGGAAAGAGIGAMIKRMTGGSTATSDTVTSERGFQNLGGRKLESVLISGGDGYGEPSGPGAQTPSSFYRGWQERFPYDTSSQHSSMIVGPATPYRRPSSSIAELSSSRPDSETLRTMPTSPRGPPAWPLSNTSAGIPVGPSTTSESSDSVLPLPNSRSIDPLGRSRLSQDGSRNSRFTEGL